MSVVRSAVWAALLVLATSSAMASPTPQQLDAARAEFERGLHAEDAGRFDEALTHYRSVAEVKVTPQVRLHIAFCLQKLGKLVEAAAELDRARADGVALGAQGDELATRAARERDELYASTPRLSVKLHDGSRPKSIVLDGVAVDLSADPIAIDPGTHHIVIDVAGKRVERDVVAREQRPAMVAEVLLDDAPRSSFHVHPVTIVGAGLTVATFVAVAITGTMQLSTASTLDGVCGTDHHQCPSSSQGDINTVDTLTNVTNGLLIAGATLAVATAIVFFTTSFGSRSRPSTVGLVPFGFGVRF